MLVSHFFDLLPIWVLLLGTMLIMVVFIESGFRLGKRAQSNARKAQTSQVRAIMGAGLGLLAFMLAFTFSTAQSHFEMRVQGLAEEARIARNAFMQADLLIEPDRSQAKHLLKDYVEMRSDLRRVQGLNVEVHHVAITIRHTPGKMIGAANTNTGYAGCATANDPKLRCYQTHGVPEAGQAPRIDMGITGDNRRTAAGFGAPGNPGVTAIAIRW